MDKKSKIAVLGYGAEGQAVADYLKAQDYKDITICDEKADLSVEESGFGVKTGPDAFKDLGEFKYIFRSPGIHKDHPELVNARDVGAIITSGTKLFFDICPCKIIGVTGTKGKGTTSTLIYSILKEAGHDVYLGGNIGTSPFEFVSHLKKNSTVILELSSFQLHDLEKSPHISVVLNTTSEHLDYHKDVEEYLSAKESIVRYQSEEDVVIVNIDYPYHTRFAALTKGQRLYVSRDKKVDSGAFVDNHKIMVSIDKIEQEICATDEIGLIGPHNIENVMPAVTVCAYLEVSREVIAKVIREFKGLPHRIEFVGEVDGASYYNDSFSTTPETCIAAINSFDNPIVLIAGGSEKKSDFTQLGKAIMHKQNLGTVVLMGKTGDRIEEAIEQAGGQRNLTIVHTSDYKEAFLAAKLHATEGSAVLLSPASASFDMFKNYKVRGETFRKWVESL